MRFTQSHKSLPFVEFWFLVLSTSVLMSCSDATTTTISTTDTSTTFPTSLSVSSPTEVVVEDATPSLKAGLSKKSTLFARIQDWIFPQAIAAANKVPRYTWATLRIDALLNGTSSVTTMFKPALFLTTDINATCFGPTLNYTDHPDASTPNSGQLPSGVLGIWLEVDSASDHACGAAQLNARMRGISWRSNMALMGLASVIGQLNTAGVALPSADDSNSVDATTVMNALSIAGTTFTSVTLSLDTTGAIWTYVMNFTYVDGSSISHDIELKLVHTPGTSTSVYSGLLTYGITDVFNGGNCPGTDPKNITHIGTLKYTRTGLSDIALTQRSGQYCGIGGFASLATFKGDGQLDPAGKWNSSAETGWADNFSRFGAKYNPTTLEGDYLYGWQAGFGDSSTRLFAITLNAPATSGQVSSEGEAYFGYGAEIAATNGDITGIYCNWAGPGNTSTLPSYAQRQALSYNTSTFLWAQPTGDADILYAPTNDCTYDGTGSFWYDRNLNTSNDEAASDINVFASGSTPLLDLMGPGVSVDIPTEIARRGFTKPAF